MQSEEHPSPDTVLPSSQTSFPSMIPSPHSSQGVPDKPGRHVVQFELPF